MNKALLHLDHLQIEADQQGQTIPGAPVPVDPPQIDPLETLPSYDLLHQWGPQRALKTGLLPWREIGGTVVILSQSEEAYIAYRGALTAAFGKTRWAHADRMRCQAAIQRLADPVLIQHAEARPQACDSCRDLQGSGTRLFGWALLLSVIAWGYWAPASLFIGLSCLATVAALSGSLYKCAAAVALLFAPPCAEDPPLGDADDLPVISILVPLFREEHIAEHLLERLKRLNYPRDKLDLILIVERSDQVTQQTIARTPLPPWIRAISVPPGTCQTKPRAMNYALDFARGDIIGVFDAEDAPAPDQLLVVARRFAVAPPETVCLQGILDFYNTESNWLSRCFTIEYAAWFRVAMPGLQRLGFILPLGGTTLFFKRAVLEELGAWDAHNVTEDADLGVRLARHGYKTEMIPTTTEEEANARVWPWVKQRSRWLKGYAVTYWVAMRRPARLIREIGLWRVMGLNLQFAATVTTFALAPILWSFWLALLGLPHPFMSLIGTTGGTVLSSLFVLSEVLAITFGAVGAYASGRPWLIKWAPTMHFYYPLAALACYKALWELIVDPFYWDKTAHGIFQPTKIVQNDL